jgi:hypothetical protein
MEAASIPTIQKQQFRNNTRGWIGAVSIGPKGDEKGVAIEPGGTVWLSQAEQILTANAPRRAEDNPFLPQPFVWFDPETGERNEETVTPLTAISEDRFVPASERPIPGTVAESGAGQAAVAQAAATGDSPEVPVIEERTAATREAEVTGEAPAPPPRAAQAAAAVPVSADVPQDITPPRPAPEQAAEVPQAGPPQPPPPATPGSTEPPVDTGLGDPNETAPPAPAEEETAAQSPGPASEETGAAVPPAGPAAEGQFQRGEEVGTPQAPAAPPPPAAPPEG